MAASPSINRLPLELLSASFTALVPCHDSKLEDVIEFWNARSAVSRVCKHWLETSSTTLSLWKRIWIFRFTPPTYLDLELSKAVGVDLAVHLNMAERREIQIGDNVRTVACASPAAFLSLIDKSLRPKFHAVAGLSTTTWCPDEWKSLASRLSSYSPDVLRFFAVSNLSHIPLMDASASLFTTASNLRKVAISGLVPRGNPGMYSRVVSLELARICMFPGMPWSLLCATLRSCVALERLVLTAVKCVDVDSSSIATLPSLGTLVFTPGDDDGCLLLGGICAPHLRHLGVNARDTSSLTPVINHGEHLLRVALTVQTTCWMPHGNGFARFLSKLDQVTTLDLRGAGWVKGYRNKSEYSPDARAFTELLRAMHDLPALLPSIDTVKVRGDTQTTESEAIEFGRVMGARVGKRPWSLQCYFGVRGAIGWTEGEGGIISHALADTDEFEDHTVL